MVGAQWTLHKVFSTSWDPEPFPPLRLVMAFSKCSQTEIPEGNVGISSSFITRPSTPKEAEKASFQDPTGQRGWFSLPRMLIWSWGRSPVSPPASTPWKGPDQLLRATKDKESAGASSFFTENQKTAPVRPALIHRNPGGALLIHFPFFLLPHTPAAHPYWGFGRRQSLDSSPHPTPAGSF